MKLSKKQQQRLNLKDSGLHINLDYSKYCSIVNESVIIKFMSFLGMKYWGAIDTQETEEIFDYFGLIITPANNQGEDMWYIENYL